jgi:glycosyltransferase involved in cell wall biosynthesis
MKRQRGSLLTVVAQGWPPQVSGSAILLSNLLSEYSGEVNVLAGYDEYAKSDLAFEPPCFTVPLGIGSVVRLSPRLFSRLRRTVPGVVSRILQGSIYRALKKLGSDLVMAAYPHDIYLVATYLAVRRLGLPLYVHMHDLWMEVKPEGTTAARFAEQWEPIILKDATRVLCMTEAMQDHYQKKYNLATGLLPHSISEKDFLTAAPGLRAPQLPHPTVLFVGGVSAAMNMDALRVLAAASELLPKEYELLFCTQSDVATLKRDGIVSSRLRVQYVSRATAQHLQAQAHVLVAPLSHNNCAVHEVRTVFSTKLLEYLISGRPIVIFAPDDSYHAESARKNGWGYVVTTDSPAALAKAIERVATDEDLAGRLVEAALREARRRRANLHAKRLGEWVITDAVHGR